MGDGPEGRGDPTDFSPGDSFRFLDRSERFGYSLCMQERRSAPRIGFNLRVRVIQKENQSIELLRANLSWGGLGGYTRDPIEKEEAVSAEIFFVNRAGENISEKVPGRVVWAHRDGNFNAFGIAFSVLTAAAHPQVVSYIRYTEQFD